MAPDPPPSRLQIWWPFLAGALGAVAGAAWFAPPDGVEALMTQASATDRLADRRTYFEGYSKVTIQKRMLDDAVRMRAYRDAILGNADRFRGKVIRRASLW